MGPGSGAVTGTLVVPVPANDLAGASGLSVRLLFDTPGSGMVPSFQWGGLEMLNTSSGATAFVNSYGRFFAAATGAGTVTHPAVPYINGLYTTVVLASGGTTVYVGPYQWALLPGVYFAPSGQGALTTANRVTLYGANLYDFQVYNVALNASQVVALSEGVAAPGC